MGVWGYEEHESDYFCDTVGEDYIAAMNGDVCSSVLVGIMNVLISDKRGMMIPKCKLERGFNS